MQMCPECSADNKDSARFCVKCGALLRRLRGRGTVLHRRYRLERVLGCGGMGAVYFATDLRLNSKVAVKENLDMSPESQKQFGMEARILAALRHPNLPRVQDFFVADGRQYLVMDYIAGESLEDIVKKRGPLPPQMAVKWMTQVMEAVHYLHSQNPPVIHRDIKPSNIKIGPDNRAYLVDFGIAKILKVGSRTQAGARAVTPGYSPPEQYGTAPTDQRSDIYALGATLYFAVTGRIPPEAIERITGKTDKLIPPRSINPTIPPNLEQVILRAMKVNREERFSSVKEMVFALRFGLQQRYRPTAPQPRPTAQKQLQPSSFPLRPPLPKGISLAPFWLRALAFTLDILIWSAAAWMLTFGYAFLLSVAGNEDFGWIWSQIEQRNVFSFTLVLGFPIYRSLAHTLTDRTIGKAMVGLKIFVKDGRPCGFWRALGREVALLFSLAPCFMGALWTIFDPHKQGWHDLIVGTFVVRESENGT
ncbi:MAG: protein kinase domain-containing protein [Candidatus Fervidibacter sp.]|uniref:protein kinase domain-containing protein n=2 Tax=Candidatus Fervidibacter sp. TaxID=3100871 RepID=UPI00404B9B44